MLKNKVIAFIGGGNMARAILHGLIQQGHSPDNFVVSNRGEEKRQALVRELGIRAVKTNALAVVGADILVLAVKPQVVGDVCREIAPDVTRKKPLLISLVSVARLDDLTHSLGVPSLSAVRVMTNTTVEVGCGMSVLVANAWVTNEEKQCASALFNAVGDTSWVNNETDFNRYTPLVGSAPAYVFLLIEALKHAAITTGIPPALADKIALTVVRGAGQLASLSELSVDKLRQKVTTPHGITAASFEPLMRVDFMQLFVEVFQKADARSHRLDEALHLELS